MKTISKKTIKEISDAVNRSNGRLRVRFKKGVASCIHQPKRR